MLPAIDSHNSDFGWFEKDDQWRMTLSLDLEERSVLEGEVLLCRITEQNLALNRTHPQ
jgi:hypothetical protein